MSKHHPLTEAEVSGYDTGPVVDFIDQYLKDSGKGKEEIKVLDYGCGKGKLVAALRKLGYETYGVEIDPLPYHNGLGYFQERNQDPSSFLFLIGSDCKTVFTNDFFDIVISEQVLEHVKDIDLVSTEIARLTQPQGRHRHTFPSKFHFKEQHLYMPLIHWLPKNGLRRSLIQWYVKRGIEPKWPMLQEKSVTEKAAMYYEYSITKTYYRRLPKLVRMFNQLGFEAHYTLGYETGTGLEKFFNRFFAAYVTLELVKR